jgi:hypothetical protein
MLIYVCAPFTAGNGATSEWERRKRAMGAAAVGLAIVESGHTPIVPHLMFGLYYGEIDESTAMDLCLSALEACDALIACDGWDRSDGCVREVDFAGFEGKRVWTDVGAMLREIEDVES